MATWRRLALSLSLVKKEAVLVIESDRARSSAMPSMLVLADTTGKLGRKIEAI